ncbi:MAG: amidohydrolase [Deltaproteobacteria bacterium]|nr:amidohydrolase [Deltaproteobacteria bacterium]
MSHDPVDLLIKNAHIVTMNPAMEVHQPGALAIRGDTIVAVGAEKDLLGLEARAREVLDVQRGAVLPGLINTHTHAAMTLFRGLADDLPLEDWLHHHIFPAERKINAQWVYWGTLLACAEMILSGTTTFCDMYLFEAEVARAAREAGMRALVGEVLYDFPSPNYGPIEKGFDYTLQLIRDFKEDPLISVAVEPHTPFTCSPDLLRKAGAVSAEQGVPLIIHLSETFPEKEQIQKQYQTSPVGLLDGLGLLSSNLIAVHCVALSEEDMNALGKAGVKVAHCPESNMKLASGVAPVVPMMSRGITVGLGTDGCASNNNLDLFQEMSAAAKLHKVHLLDPTVMDARTVLRMATIEGAKVLQMDRVIGSLEPGKKADLIILDLKQPHLTPLYNLYSQLVYAAKGSDVTQVFINGKQVLKDRQLTTLSLRTIFEKAHSFASSLQTGS